MPDVQIMHAVGNEYPFYVFEDTFNNSPFQTGYYTETGHGKGQGYQLLVSLILSHCYNTTYVNVLAFRHYI